MPFPSPDLRLIAVDMDGTLLDDDGRIPDALWPLLDRLHERGIRFAPASGRQLATLQRAFAQHLDHMVVIAENGAYVVVGEHEISSDAMDAAFTRALVRRVRALTDRDLGVVVCGKRSAYIERADDAFHAEADKYYAHLEIVADLLQVDDQILKVAIFDFDDAATTAPALDDIRATHQVVVSGEHWIDVMNLGVNKGVALQRLQAATGITRAQTEAFGDYLNDLEMMDAAALSFAMANAHPLVAERARYAAPSNLDLGVITTIEKLLDGLPDERALAPRGRRRQRPHRRRVGGAARSLGRMRVLRRRGRRPSEGLRAADLARRPVHLRERRSGMPLVQREQEQRRGDRLAPPQASRRARLPAAARRGARRVARVSARGCRRGRGRRSRRGRHPCTVKRPARFGFVRAAGS
jgi:Cof subfamily protein (haloacid dehalogenase superfamily)